MQHQTKPSAECGHVGQKVMGQDHEPDPGCLLPFSARRVTLAVPWFAMGSCTALSPGAKAVLCLATRVFTPRFAPCCPGLKKFWLATAKLSSSSTETALRGELEPEREKESKTGIGGGVLKRRGGQRVA